MTTTQGEGQSGERFLIRPTAKRLRQLEDERSAEQIAAQCVRAARERDSDFCWPQINDDLTRSRLSHLWREYIGPAAVVKDAFLPQTYDLCRELDLRSQLVFTQYQYCRGLEEAEFHAFCLPEKTRAQRSRRFLEYLHARRKAKQEWRQMERESALLRLAMWHVFRLIRLSLEVCEELEAVVGESLLTPEQDGVLRDILASLAETEATRYHWTGLPGLLQDPNGDERQAFREQLDKVVAKRGEIVVPLYLPASDDESIEAEIARHRKDWERESAAARERWEAGG